MNRARGVLLAMTILFSAENAAQARVKYIYVMPTSHWNLGGNYRHVPPYHFALTPDVVKRRYKEHLDRALEACLQRKELSWTITTTWMFQAWWERTPDRKPARSAAAQEVDPVAPGNSSGSSSDRPSSLTDGSRRLSEKGAGPALSRGEP